MPIDWENNVITKNPHQKTRFTSVSIEDPMSCHKFFGKYTSNQETILVCEPQRASCLPYIIIPQGTISVVLSSGAFEGYGSPGFRWCLPFTEAKYLVSQQDFVYQSPINRVLTRDNSTINISVSILLSIMEENEYVQQLVTNVGEINEFIDANIIERVRTMARGVKAKEAYSLRGDKHAQGMKEHMAVSLGNKGVQIKRCIITSVELDPVVADSMQETTIYQFKNTLERKKFAFEQRIKNDQEEELKARQIKEEERKDENEKAQLQQLQKKKEIDTVKAKTQRIKSEWQARTDAKIEQIDADTELKVSEIIAEANLIETQIIEQANGNAAKMIAEADAYRATTVANAQAEVAPLIAKAVTLEGEAEMKLQKGFAQKRTHEQILRKIAAVESFASNKNSVISGDQSGNLLAQVETFNMIRK